MRTKKKRIAEGKLLDAWLPPKGAEGAVGCIATTFTFSPVFFEEECLGRFLQMQSDAIEDGPVYVIEREEKLAEIRCVSVLVDAYHCRGERSLHWDLLPARVPQEILHAKIAILHWQNLIRVIIGSGNLTEDGYRRNQEIFSIVDYHANSDSPLGFLDEIIDYMREIFTYGASYGSAQSPATDRWQDFLSAVFEASRDLGTSDPALNRKKVNVYPVLTGKGRASALDQVTTLWPEGSPPAHAIVTSPFFDPPGAPNRPALNLWGSLKKRGEASVTFNLTAEDVHDDSSIFLHAPEEIVLAQPQGRSALATHIKLIDERQDDTDTPFRPLHLKSYLFEGTDWIGYLIGSSNFASKGLGLSTSPNLEANLLYLVSKKGRPKTIEQILKCVPKGTPIKKGTQLQWLPRQETGEDEPEDSAIPLPKEFGQALYYNDQSEEYIVLRIEDTPPSGWQIYKPTVSEKFLYDETTWRANKQPKAVKIVWQESAAPSGFEVSWKDSNGRAWWPINVFTAASLPPPAELRDLPLEVLVNILTSARPLHQVLGAWMKRKKNGASESGSEIYDPHKRVDTSGFLLQKTYRVTSALSGLRTRLSRPVPSEDALQWRLNGPVGVSAVSQAIVKESRSKGETAFLLTELALEISRAKTTSAPGCLPEEKVNREIRSVIADLQKEAKACLRDKSADLYQYIDTAFKEALS